mmetsp:Transcript_32218/g.80214  ORF Transcript_32218/g.80214 Transcript_32218/m.80214 type:complete len:222 (+) Transcript_32218:722-1387(+)
MRSRMRSRRKRLPRQPTRRRRPTRAPAAVAGGALSRTPISLASRIALTPRKRRATTSCSCTRGGRRRGRRPRLRRSSSRTHRLSRRPSRAGRWCSASARLASRPRRATRPRRTATRSCCSWLAPRASVCYLRPRRRACAFGCAPNSAGTSPNSRARRAIRRRAQRGGTRGAAALRVPLVRARVLAGHAAGDGRGRRAGRVLQEHRPRARLPAARRGRAPGA